MGTGVSASRMIAPSSRISCSLIAHRSNAVDHSNIGILSFGWVEVFGNVVGAVNHKDTRSIAKEVTNASFLTDKSFLG